ncbi:uncharacterized protein EDB91DRAFT_537786 [Suillus paluster]|uniref:uncharacterized protein n=1 Tax=Suillus paluster TaxID=48578 RepID=UPI001B863339|nr:uncharacterized protein EDB91DRAFT_537786 [Suillus paluster]KAG1736116.1 hypothetical protein EDB91DRAFT_537786 [Suillus paluster]
MLHSPAPILHRSRSERCSSPFAGSMTSSCGLDILPLMSPSQSTEDIFRTIMKVRKNWKIMKGDTKPVWPPYLEATMLKGLQEYEPVSREAQLLGRFPKRSRFISQYIYRQTGRYRSSKQISSRLQQLRDTSEGRELIDSLTQGYLARRESGSSQRLSPHNQIFEAKSKPPFSTSDNSYTSSSAGSPISSAKYSPVMPSSKQNHLPDTRPLVYIDILPEPSLFSSSSSSSLCAPSASPYQSPQGIAASHPSSNAPRRMRDIDPTATFVSPSAVIGKSSYIVLLDGAPIHSEDTKLECVGPYLTGSSGDGLLLHTTTLVPKYWETLCKSPDPTVYTIIQDVYSAPDSETSTRSSGRPHLVPIFSATYHFRYPVSVCTPPSSMSPHFAYQANSSFLANNTHASPDLLYRMSPSLSDQWWLQSHECNTQNQLDEPFILDLNLDEFSFDDFIHDLPEATSKEMIAQSSSSLPKDIRNYIM